MTQMRLRHLVDTATGEMWRNGLVSRCQKPGSPVSQFVEVCVGRPPVCAAPPPWGRHPQTLT